MNIITEKIKKESLKNFFNLNLNLNLKKKKIIIGISTMTIFLGFILGFNIDKLKGCRYVDDVDKIVEKMTLEEKIGQMFVIRPETLDSLSDDKKLTQVTAQMRENYKKFPVGGYCLYRQNIVNTKQLNEFIKNLNEMSSSTDKFAPFLTIDEEGGRVARLANHPDPDFAILPKVESMYSVGQTKDVSQAYDTGKKIGNYLKSYGFGVDFAPVVDVWSNPVNKVIGNRSFGHDPELVANMALSYLNGLHAEKIIGCYKHFPGHGDTEKDTHTDFAVCNKSLKELMKCELRPYIKAIESGYQPDMVMISHVSYPALTGSDCPATLSREIIQDLLRTKLGYNGVVITDGLEMKAITEYCCDHDKKVAVQVINAGNDIVLCATNFEKEYTDVVKAVKAGEISEKRINESVKRIIELKIKYNIIK